MNNDNPLHVLPEEKALPEGKEKEDKGQDPSVKDEQKIAFALPDGYLLAHEMRELFDEDIVTHVQGASEPEAE